MIRGRGMYTNFEILMSGLACVHSEYCGCEVFVIGKSVSLRGLCVSSSVGTMTDRFKDCARQVNLWLQRQPQYCKLQEHVEGPPEREIVIYASRKERTEILFARASLTIKGLQNLLGDRLKHKGNEIRFVIDDQHLDGGVIVERLVQRSLRYVFKWGAEWEA